MEQGKPITTFLVTALVLWAIYLWKHGRLGKTALLPSPAGPVNGPPLPPGWQAGTPPLVMPKSSDVGPLEIPQTNPPNIVR